MIDAKKLLSLANSLHQLNEQYMHNKLKHFQYVAKYDDILANANITQLQMYEALNEHKAHL